MQVRFYRADGSQDPAVLGHCGNKITEAGMFCPKCRAEYREGFHTCSDCKIELVESGPPLSEPVPEFIEYVEIVATYNPVDVVFLDMLV